MFRCLRCRQSTSLPTCEHRGYVVEVIDGVYQLTDDPNTNLDDAQGIKYIGYDRIGAYYHTKRWTETPCDPSSMAVGQKVSELIGRGILLDVGCGGGNHAVPAALHGCTVVAGDISNVMLTLLLQKAATNHVDPNRIIACRMNALHLPLCNASVDGAMVNSVLHLISQPERVIAEIHRVLKPGGKLMMQVHSRGLPDTLGPELQALNREYARRESEFHRRYWEFLTAWVSSRPV